MADTIITKKVTDLTENTAVSDEDLFLVGNAGTAALRKVKWSNIFSKINELIKAKVLEWTFENLGTTNKTIPGAIEELNTNISKVISIKTVSSSIIRVSALSTFDTYINCSPDDGYSIIGITGFTANYSKVVVVGCRWDASNNRVHFTVHNNNDIPIDTNVICNLIQVKTKLL